MFTRSASLACFLMCVVAATAPAVCRAGTVVFPMSAGGTGHEYEVVFDPAVSYADASAAATATGGHLVSITSPAEQAFVEGLLVGADAMTGSYWIGLQREGTGVDFGWCTGEPLSFNNFAGGEPNDYVRHEDYGQIYWAKNPADDMHDRSGHWNDAPMAGYPDGDFAGEPTPDLGRAGFIIERLETGGNPPPTAIPLPPALLAAPAGFGLAAFAGRRRRKDE
jgi:hypothetical protein